MSADRDREKRLAEALAEHFTRTFTPTGTGFTLVGCGCGWRGSEWIHIDDAAREHREHIAAELLALPAFRAAGEGDRLRRDLAETRDVVARLVRAHGITDTENGALFADRLDDLLRARAALLDGGEGGR